MGGPTDRTFRSKRMAGTAFAAVVLTAACGGGGDQGRSGGDAASPREAASPPGGSGEQVSTADLLEMEEAAVTEAHRAAMDARIESAAPPRPDLPSLAETHVDPMLSDWTARLGGMESQGLVIRYPEDTRLSVDVLDVAFSWGDVPGAPGVEEAGPGDVGNVATVEVCILDDGEIVRTATGEVTRGGGVYTIHETAVLHRVDGAWKLAERRVNSERAGETGCAAG